MTDENLMKRPEFGEPPPPVGQAPRLRKRMEFEDLLDIVREHPNVWAKVAFYKGGINSGRHRTHRMCIADQMRITRHLRKYYPLEDWNVSTRMVPETWADRELWVIFRGVMTPEDALKLRQAREQAYSTKIDRGKTEREKRIHRQRAKAELEMLENRLRGGPAG